MTDEANNPFAFDVDFEKVKNRRRVREQQKKQQQVQQQQQLLQGMDALHEGDFEGAAGGTGVGVAATTSSSASAPTNRMLQIFRRGRMGAGGEEKNEPVLYGGKKVIPWPFDDYHQVQQKHYTKLEELSLNPEEETKEGTTTGIPTPLATTTPSSSTSTSAAYQRPADPPEIPQAVVGLSLVDFEATARARAIARVSTWLFDAALVDELLVHGGMPVLHDMDDNQSTSQGVEVGLLAGLPVEGVSKLDKEIAKFRGATQQQLALINARLNDGVAASGAEVQELVHAVTNTKDDLGKLRELTTYIRNAGDVEQRSSRFLLTRYPKLKKAINARRNLAKCFRELDFYSQIPVTCERLREALHNSEWTAQEWTTLRDVSREHVELEIFLVEAEAGMKRRIDEETMGSSAAAGKAGGRRRSSQGGGMSTIPSPYTKGLPHNYEEVDNFLHEHVKNVWELGDEISLRILSGIGTAFELAMNNPAGMVSLVEAVEVYETANEEYKTVHGEEAGDKHSLRFTDMRASALKQLYQDFEMRALEVFREVHASIPERDMEEEFAVDEELFSAVLRACNGLTSEIAFVQNQMAPCFPPHWALETLWSTCVAHVCSVEIFDQIGGHEGHKLQDLTVTQLLDLVAWVENFRETIEETFPNIGDHVAKKTYFDQRPDLLMDNNKTVDLDVAKDSLAWANNTLWEVHDLAKDEFLYRTKEQTDEWLDNVYDADHTKNQTSEGRLVTSLCEDVFSLAGVQLRTIRERLTRRSEALVQAVGVIFKNLYEKQMASRDMFLLDLETCCAAANDFIRMSEHCEEIVQDLQAECNLSETATEALEEQSAILLGLYSTDAVYASQKCHIYIFEPIEEAISEELFGEEWLTELTSSELALTLVRTLEDFMGDLEVFLDELMVGKTVDAMLTATVNFYIKALLKKSASHKDGKKSAFSNNVTALTRMQGDIRTMKDYFLSLAPSFPALNRAIEPEFEVLDTILELLAIASGKSSSSAKDFVLLLQKRLRNLPITKLMVGDLWHLVNPKEEKAMYELMDSMEDELKAVAPTDETAMQSATQRSTVPGLRLDQEVARLLDEGKRSRPGMNQSAMEQADAMFNRWRETFKGFRKNQMKGGEE